MTDIIIPIITALSPSAFPLVVCFCVCAFLYFKIGRDRKQTKEERDGQKDELDKRLTLVEHDVTFMKAEHSLFAGKLDRILTELTEIKVALAKKADIKQARDD